MTFSIAARCSRTGQLGVAAITAVVGVGKLATHARAGTGAIATQAMVNPYLAIDGLRHLASGCGADEALAAVLDADPGRDLRQCGIVDREGRAAAWTGRLTLGWAGHRTGVGFSAQGNRLVGPETIDAVVARFEEAEDLDLADRLLQCLEVGEETGADRNGAVSGAIYVVDTEEYPRWDLRVDHADDPAAALRDLLEEYREQFLPMIDGLPTRQDPLGRSARRQLAR
jgi:uncharacterized Ntn-hydrolase superfamily protein